jgi:2'-5' RNA ligase
MVMSFTQPRRDRLFLAALVPAPLNGELEERTRIWARSQGWSDAPVPAKKLHVSLIGFGEYAGLPSEAIDWIIARVRSFSFPAFNAAFDRLAKFTGPFVLTGSAGATDGFISLQRDLIRHVFGKAQPANRAFTPHVSLLWTKEIAKEQVIAPLRWQAREVVLIRSTAGVGHAHLAHSVGADKAI